MFWSKVVKISFDQYLKNFSIGYQLLKVLLFNIGDIQIQKCISFGDFVFIHKILINLIFFIKYFGTKLWYRYV